MRGEVTGWKPAVWMDIILYLWEWDYAEKIPTISAIGRGVANNYGNVYPIVHSLASAGLLTIRTNGRLKEVCMTDKGRIVAEHLYLMVCALKRDFTTPADKTELKNKSEYKWV